MNVYEKSWLRNDNNKSKSTNKGDNEWWWQQKTENDRKNIITKRDYHIVDNEKNFKKIANKYFLNSQNMFFPFLYRRAHY